MQQPDVPRIQQRLKQIDDYVAKGLMRLDEAEAERTGLKRRLLDLALPDGPAPGLPWRARFGALAAMGAVVLVVLGWLLFGDAGLKPKAVQMLAAAAGRPQPLPAVHPAEAPLPAATPASGGPPAPASGAATPAAAAPGMAVQVGIDPRLARRTDPDSAVFIELHLPGDTGLPLAAVRRRVADLPLSVRLDAAQAVGDPARLAAAAQVVASARVSLSGRGLPAAGDLEGTAPPAPAGASGVRVLIDRQRR